MSYDEGGHLIILFFVKEEKCLAEEYKSNSHKSKDLVVTKEEKSEPVVQGSVSLKKQTGVGKFARSILAEDMRSVSSYVLSDIIVPSFKKAIDDIISNGIHMLLYGRSASPKSSSTKMSYGSYYYGGTYAKSIDEPPIAKPSSNIYDYDEFLLPTKGAALAVQERMDDVLEQYQIVSVNDLYEIMKMTVSECNIPAPPYTIANKYGWTNLRSIEIYPVRDGYVLKLPRIKEL